MTNGTLVAQKIVSNIIFLPNDICYAVTWTTSSRHSGYLLQATGSGKVAAVHSRGVGKTTTPANERAWLE
jgi:hypothetical protein